MTNPNKILMIFIEPTPYILGLITRINKVCQHKVDVFSLKENFTQPWDLIREIDFEKVPNGFLNKIRFAIAMMKQKYDLIHLAGWREPLFILMMFLSCWYKKTISVESDTPAFQHGSYYKKILKKIILPSIFKNIDLFLPGGKRQAQYIEQFGVSSHKITPVNMTVDVLAISNKVKQFTQDRFIQIRKGLTIPSNAFVYLFVGRLLKIKGIENLTAAFKQISNPNAFLLFVGEGEMADHIEAQANIDARIRWLKRKSGDALIELYYIADVIVLPSHKENWGLVINEAMAVGKPVIISDQVGCMDDLVANKQTGLISKTGSSKSLKSAMEYIHLADDHRQQMQENCLAEISHWTLENEAIKICQAWHGLISTLKINPL